MRCCTLLGPALVIGLASLAGLPTQARPVPAADAYSIDPVHSSVAFRIKHMNLAPFYGQFNDISGTVKLDAADPTKSEMEVSIKVDAVDSHNEKRDAHLKSPDFFNAKNFPTMTFKSKSFAKSGDHAFDVSGDLTIHGVTKPITVKLEKTGEGKSPMGGQAIGFGTEFTIKRSDFGMSGMLDALGDEVRVMIGLEAGKK